MVKFYLLTFPRFSLRKKEHKSYFGKNRTHDFRTSRCAGYLLLILIDHSGDEGIHILPCHVKVSRFNKRCTIGRLGMNNMKYYHNDGIIGGTMLFFYAGEVRSLRCACGTVYNQA